MGEVHKVGAFFDLDGTVIVPPSLELRFAAHLACKGKLRPAAIAQWFCVLLQQMAKSLSSGTDIRARLNALDGNKAYLAGVKASEARDWSDQHAASLEFFPDAMRQIAWHRERGDKIFLISGTLAPLARAVVSHLLDSADFTLAATELVEFEGSWTGQIAGAAVCGPAKATEVKRLAAINEIDLSRSYAYGDSSSDRWMLGAVGNALAVNPGITLATLARKSGWKIARWPRMDPFLERACGNAGQPILSREKLSWK